MAIDYGDTRTGVAISDLTRTITGEAWVIEERNPRALAKQLIAAARQRDVEMAALGYPRNMDGTLGPRAEVTQTFAETLREMGLSVALWDERRTTVDAHRILTGTGRHGKKRKNRLDAVAASLILEGYLAYLANHSEQTPPEQ
ncbi:MAG: Holliday junction resolvase RuvX [Oscillospiraceae bacterium]|jgi:putative Holliday junction resolvase|nr:Holliday junction resolvase RuvX [Oscillospiraceae bacterium]